MQGNDIYEHLPSATRTPTNYIVCLKILTFTSVIWSIKTVIINSSPVYNNKSSWICMQEVMGKMMMMLLHVMALNAGTSHFTFLIFAHFWNHTTAKIQINSSFVHNNIQFPTIYYSLILSHFGAHWHFMFAVSQGSDVTKFNDFRSYSNDWYP